MGSERKPVRIQRKRTKGWKMPEGAVYVGRPTMWGNHHRIGAPNPYNGDPMSAADAVDNFRYFIERVADPITFDLSELRGKDLACWCPLDQPCHADVLLELANGKDVADAR
jgi:hypothetical protein